HCASHRRQRPRGRAPGEEGPRQGRGDRAGRWLPVRAGGLLSHRIDTGPDRGHQCLQREAQARVQGAVRRNTMSRDVFVREVGLRDGLQLVKSFVPTETKLAWIAAEATAGIPEIEATSFVPPKVIPQFADAAAVAAGIAGIEGPLMCALAPNRKGAELAL